MLLYVNSEGEPLGHLARVWMVCLWWSLLNHKIHPEIGLSKEKIWANDQLWKMLVLLMIRLRVNNEYKEYLRTREYECIETIA